VNTSSEKPASREIGPRKEKHLAICTDPSRFQVEGAGAGFDGVRFLHNALPESAEGELDTAVEFLGHQVRLPFFISCMTGGSEGGFRANRLLASAAQELGIPVGLGSLRALMTNPDLFPHFHIKPAARDVPVLANIGAGQVRDGEIAALLSVLAKLEVQALVVHLNVGQELFQPEGDRDFRGLKAALVRLCDRCTLPVIVKETGFGIGPRLVRQLLDSGVAYVDLAGAGGTNWISVESYRLPEEQRIVAAEFSDWGAPTALLLAACAGARQRILASGGIRTGMDAAKAIAMGAELAGLALPVIRAVVSGGNSAVVGLFRAMERTLRTVMLLTGSRRVSDLRRGTIWREPGFAAAVESYAMADARAGDDGRDGQ
jgi:isopentenyl-diphosphate Delta-isomerase